jgi:acyl-CoA synthetase (NDP forming)
VPVFGDPLRCVRAVAARLNWEAARRHARDDAPPSIFARHDRGTEPRGYAHQQSLLQHYGIDIAPGGLAHALDDARGVALDIGYPVVAKLIAPALLHKSDVGGVVLGIADETALTRAVDALLHIPCDDREGILIQPMIADPGAIELFAGFTQDPVFGPLVVFGLGGIFVDVIREVVMRPAPFGVDAASGMIRDARFFRLLQGFRGRPPCDLAALASLLARVSVLASAEPSWLALDLNPVLASPRGATVVDFKFERSHAAAKTAG